MVKQKQLVALTILILCLVASAVSVAFAGKPQDINDELIEIADMIDGELAFDHVEELALDYYEGRLSSTAGCEAAAGYIADKFEEYGLDPFGDGGTSYLETFPVTYWLASDWSLDVLTPPGIAGPYSSYAMEYCTSGDVTAELVYVGLGGPDDYSGPITGEIAFILRGVYTFEEKVEVAHDHGAAGVIVFDHTDEPLFSGTLGHPQEIPAMSLTREDGKTILEAMGFTVTIDDHLDPADISGTQTSYPTAHIYVDAVVKEDQPTSNVLGIIYGADKPDEYVVIGAHYDHLGVMKGEVYNGADDNAAGVAVVIELARVLHQYADSCPVTPRRSIIFAAWTAEEEGLYGSDYFVKTHQKLLLHIKIMLNLDMPGAGEWVHGEPRNNMYIEDTAHQYEYGDQPVYTSSGKEWAPRLVYDVAQLLIREERIEIGIDYYTEDPYYENGYALYHGIEDVKVVEYIGRSDHEPFLLAGVPATAIFSGADRYPEFHQPGDDIDRVDQEKLVISGMLAGCSAWKVAQHATQPAVAAAPTTYPAIGARHVPVLPEGEIA